MEPVWKLYSGKFAGWREGDALYNATGKHVGYFVGDIVYALSGQYLGELYGQGWLGKRTTVTYPPKGSKVGYASIATRPLLDRSGRTVGGWADPEC